MSFAEFMYPLLQSWDWWYMYDTKDIQVQVGGADQFGNILAGIDAINHIRHNLPEPHFRHDETKKTKEESFLKKPMGFTVPLLTTASGEKFGKSAGNAIWLDREMTSSFDLYQVTGFSEQKCLHRLSISSSFYVWLTQMFIAISTSSLLNLSTRWRNLWKSTKRNPLNELPSTS